MSDNIYDMNYRIHVHVLHLQSIAEFHVYRQRTPLHFSSKNGHVDVSSLLISSKADVDPRDNEYV
jgi:hypothetical protein